MGQIYCCAVNNVLFDLISFEDFSKTEYYEIKFVRWIASLAMVYVWI